MKLESYNNNMALYICQIKIGYNGHLNRKIQYDMGLWYMYNRLMIIIMRRTPVLTANGRFPLLNRTELAGQLLLSVPPPIEHLVGLGAFLFTEYIGK